MKTTSSPRLATKNDTADCWTKQRDVFCAGFRPVFCSRKFVRGVSIPSHPQSSTQSSPVMRQQCGHMLRGARQRRSAHGREGKGGGMKSTDGTLTCKWRSGGRRRGWPALETSCTCGAGGRGGDSGTVVVWGKPVNHDLIGPPPNRSRMVDPFDFPRHFYLAFGTPTFVFH